MENKFHNPENFFINKLPTMPLSQNYLNNFHGNRNNSKRISDKNNNLKIINGSFQKKTNYKINLRHFDLSTIEINKNISGNNSYQIQNLTNEKNNFENDRKKLIVNKANIKLKNKLDKNRSFLLKKEKREISFNKKDKTPNLLKHISLKSKNKNINENTNKIIFRHLSNSEYAQLNSNKKNNINFLIKPNFLQYDYEQNKLINKNNLMNLIQKLNKSNNNKENDKNHFFKEKNLNDINSEKIKNKIIINNNINNIYIKMNNNLAKNNNKQGLKINLNRIDNQVEYFNENNEKEIELTKEEKLIYGNIIK